MAIRDYCYLVFELCCDRKVGRCVVKVEYLRGQFEVWGISVNTSGIFGTGQDDDEASWFISSDIE